MIYSHSCWADRGVGQRVGDIVGHRTRQRGILAIALLLGALACSPIPDRPTGQGGTAASAPTSRALLTRDLDHPPLPDCSTPRYGDPDRSMLPAEFRDGDYELTSARTPERSGSIHHLCGQKGPGVDLAWGVTKGRNDVVIAVLDSGIKWRDAKEMGDLATKAHLNAGELPPPQGGSTYDRNNDGVFNIADYANDTRVTDRNKNKILDPEDLILDPQFSNGIDDDHNGYVDDISGWDFLWGDNDPLDNVEYGHGTGEARDSTAVEGGSTAFGGGGAVGTCPQCQFLPVRVSDSFIAEGGRFGAGVLFSIDSHVDVIQEALGAINNPLQAQAAVDAAYRRNIPIVASMADEASKHPNLPAAMNHTIPVNSVTRVSDVLSDLNALPGVETDVLALNGCTNYGSIAWVTVPSSSCSSGATGLGSGMVGLMESQARTSGMSLTSNEVAQLLRGTADDIDFATPNANEPANDVRGDNFERYPTGPGWDATFGYGRVNTYEAVRAIAGGEIPPEADLVGPSWFDVLPVSGTVPVIGSVAAARSGSYSYRVEWTTGLQTSPYPGNDNWHVVASAQGQTAPKSGTLATLDLATIAAAIPGGASGGSADANGNPNEDRFAVRVRIVVTDAEGRHGVSHKQVFVHDDPSLVTGFPTRIPGVGSSSPVFADIDGVAGDELVVATDDGSVHAYRSSGGEAPGFPQRTPAATWWPTTSPTAIADGIAPAHSAVGVGAPVIANLTGDTRPEIAVTDMDGHLSVWSSTGTLIWRRSVDPNFSTQSVTDKVNRFKRGFLASPAAGDLDGNGTLEIVAAAMDRHVYAWNGDGSPVAGFPTLLVDPHQAKTIDPVTHHVDFYGQPTIGGELVVTPTVGDITGDGRAEIIVGAQESYPEPVAVFPGIGLPGVSGNARSYAIWGDGTAHVVASDATPGHPAEQAYLPGWPVKLAMVLNGVLPTIGDGVNAQAAIGDVNGDGTVEVVTSSSAGPVYALDRAGQSILDPNFGQQVAFSWLGTPFGGAANSQDGGLIASAFGGPALGNLSDGPSLDVSVPTVGLGRALDQLLPGKQRGDTQLSAWNGRTGAMLNGFPHRTSDLGFFITPALVDVDNDGHTDVVAANGVDLLDGVNADGKVATGYPKLTGGWSVGTPGFGDFDGNGTAEMAVARRDGVLTVWHTAAPTSSLTQWPRFGHDNRNSGDARTPTRSL